jgi:hypothetical protein
MDFSNMFFFSYVSLGLFAYFINEFMLLLGEVFKVAIISSSYSVFFSLGDRLNIIDFKLSVVIFLLVFSW